jgi:hypothetical protein
LVARFVIVERGVGQGTKRELNFLLSEANWNCLFQDVKRLWYDLIVLGAIGASADMANDALRTDEEQPTQTQPPTKPCWLRAQTEQRNDATNLMRGVTNVRTRDCGRGCDVVGACHTLFMMARTYYVTATPRVLHMATSGENRGQPEGRSAAGVTACVAPAAGWHD